jgi:general secretion pathway protein G
MLVALFDGFGNWRSQEGCCELSEGFDHSKSDWMSNTLIGRYFGFSGPFWQTRLGRIVAFTLMEMIIVVALLGTLSAIVVPLYVDYLDDARQMRTMFEVMNLEKAIDEYQERNGVYPATIGEVQGYQGVRLNDPWGTPYQYLKIAGESKTPSGARKDKFLVPLNSDYDLYSMGKDKDSRAPLTARTSWDDVIRAADGDFVGLASEY